MEIKENESLKRKTTMHIGGAARYYGEVTNKVDAEAAYNFAKEHDLPLIVLGGGANTIFAEGTINALVIRISADGTSIEGEHVTVQGGKIIATLINELADVGLDFSSMTGIPGTIGGAIFGNAGQGKTGIWIDSYVESVTAFIDGEWKTLNKEECEFEYRGSMFKEHDGSVIIWDTTLKIPQKPPELIKDDVEHLLQTRIETQPHIKTAGSCFKSLPDGTPAWKVIDEVGLRGYKVGGIEVSNKHANFLLNTGEGSFDDVCTIVKKIRSSAPAIAEIEMRLYGEDGKIVQPE